MRLTIKLKLVCGFALLALIMLGVNLFALSSQLKIKQNLDDVATTRMDRMKTSLEIDRTMNSIIRKEKNIFISSYIRRKKKI